MYIWYSSGFFCLVCELILQLKILRLVDKSLLQGAWSFINNTKMKYFILYFEHEIDGQIGYGLLQLLTNRLIWITFKFTWDQLIKGLKTGKKTHLKAIENRVMHTNLLVLRCWCLE